MLCRGNHWVVSIEVNVEEALESVYNMSRRLISVKCVFRELITITADHQVTSLTEEEKQILAMCIC